MKVVGLLCWWDEEPNRLNACVRSLAGVVDELVALDGAWELQPGGTARSPLSQAQAIHEAAAGAYVDLRAYIDWPRDLWPSQEEKRDAALQVALAQGADWILVIDADESVSYFSPFLRERLASLERDVALVGHQAVGPNRRAERPAPRRRLYRALPGLRYARSHQGIRTGDGRWLHGDTTLAGVRLEEAADLTSLLFVHHAYRSRGPERNVADRHYRRSRHAAGMR